MTDYGLDLAVIGNCRTAALLDPAARIVWWCFPRFDGDPVFCRLLAGAEENGFADVVLEDLAESSSEYIRNTAIVTTTMRDRHGGAIKVTDFAPRFYHLGRTHRPPQLIRMIEPVAGLPRVSIRIRPMHDHGGLSMQRAMGSNHIRYTGGEVALRVTTDAPLSYIDREAAFVLTRSLHLVFGSDTPFEGSLDSTCREFCDRTSTYWREWVRRLAISYDWQDATIRAAITLKLSNFEETGAVIAAHTTSIPEAPGSGRTWDYRYCWLRDAYFVVQALNRLGATRTIENFISYILTVVSQNENLQPVYSIVPTDTMAAAVDCDDLDASVLLLPELGLIEPNDPRFISTVEVIEKELRREQHVMRYVGSDDFGRPETAFLICRFWLIDTLWMIGRRDEARDMFIDALKLRNRYGLLSEAVDPSTGALWGNFPQPYSMAGLILTAIKLSRSWEDRYWRSLS